MTAITCDLLLYGPAELCTTQSKKGVSDAVHRFIDETDRL